MVRTWERGNETSTTRTTVSERVSWFTIIISCPPYSLNTQFFPPSRFISSDSVFKHTCPSCPPNRDYRAHLLQLLQSSKDLRLRPFFCYRGSRPSGCAKQHPISRERALREATATRTPPQQASYDRTQAPSSSNSNPTPALLLRLPPAPSKTDRSSVFAASLPSAAGQEYLPPSTLLTLAELA